ncbi:MAG: c-type cytochrome [Burkholderiaceae bacterium]
MRRIVVPVVIAVLIAVVIGVAIGVGSHWGGQRADPTPGEPRQLAESGQSVAPVGVNSPTGKVDLLAGLPRASSGVTPATTAGQVLYATHCAACHGVNLEGQPNWQVPNADGTLPAPPHDDSGHTWHHDDRMLFEYTKQGGQKLMTEAGLKDFRSGMPGFGAIMSDAEIESVLSFIKSRWSKRSQKVQRERNRAAGGR